MEPIKKEDYLIEYNKFIDSYKRTEVSGEEVGEIISRLAQYYANYNMQVVTNERKMSTIAKDIESRADDNGKPISSTKASVYLSATDEAHDYRVSKAHLQNIECFLNSLKALQKGILQEWQHMGNI